MRYLLFKQLKSDKELKMSREASRTMAKDTQDIIVKSKYFQTCATKKSKRFRSAFTTDQINYLESEFRTFPYIESGKRKELAKKLKIPERAVKIWFQNRRMKEKKESKQFEMEDLNKYDVKLTYEPLNNWQSNNEHHCSPFVKAKRINDSKSSVKSFAQTTVVNNMKECSSNKPTADSFVGVAMKNLSRSTFAANCDPINVGQVSDTHQKVKSKSNANPVAVSKQKKVCNAPSKNQIPGPASYCPLITSYSNIDQDQPQDLSSRSFINKLYSHQLNHYPVNSVPGPGFVPLHMQSSCPSFALPSGNMIWKPVNMMSTLPVSQSSAAVTMGVPQNSAGMHFVNNNLESSCNCNCHGSLLQNFNHVNARANPQYIIAIPFSNAPK